MKNEKLTNDKSKKIGDKKFSYSQIVSVGRSVRRYDNLLNNFIQFQEAYKMFLGSSEQVSEAFSVLENSIVSKVTHYRCMYDHMISTIF